eukprot:scaffold127991_cov33-Phaeocystis_antarctica.AAC.1
MHPLLLACCPPPPLAPPLSAGRRRPPQCARERSHDQPADRAAIGLRAAVVARRHADAGTQAHRAAALRCSPRWPGHIGPQP